jgi:hypothetical protein
MSETVGAVFEAVHVCVAELFVESESSVALVTETVVAIGVPSASAHAGLIDTLNVEEAPAASELVVQLSVLPVLHVQPGAAVTLIVAPAGSVSVRLNCCAASGPLLLTVKL